MQFYVYVYFGEDWVPYYVGKGQDRRRMQRHGVPIADKEHTQIFYFEHEWQAWECEEVLIAFWKRKCDGGCLLNVSTGGRGGTAGYKHSPKSLKKMSEAIKERWKQPGYRDRLSQAQSKRRHTTETKKKLSESAKRAWVKNPNRVSGRAKSFLITTPEGEQVTVNVMAPFCREHKLHRGTMTLVAQGKRKQHKGYTVRYLEEV